MRFFRPAVVLCLIMSGCTLDVSFTEDDRVSIVAPADRSIVRQPVEVAWEFTDFVVTGPGEVDTDDGGYFAVFVDRNPVSPGKLLSSIADDDPSCRRTPDCPDETYLNTRGVYTRTETTLQLPLLVDTRPRERPETSDWHEVTIVLVNPVGRRIGESAFSVRFVVDREQR